MTIVGFYNNCLKNYTQSLLQSAWPLSYSSNPDYSIDIGIDPSMSSSGICVILRKNDLIIDCLTLNNKTVPGHPAPLRLGSLIDAVQFLLFKITENLEPSKLHITLLSEIPPANMSSSGWLYALCQLLWLGFGPDSPVFESLHARKFEIDFHQFGIGVPQLKQIYVHWSSGLGSDLTFREISKQKSNVVKIINQIIDTTSIRPYLPKRFNNDIAEGIALALCAGGCSNLRSYSYSGELAPYPSVPSDVLHALLTNKKVNKQNQRMGWIYRPLEYSFGWNTTQASNNPLVS